MRVYNGAAFKYICTGLRVQGHRDLSGDINQRQRELSGDINQGHRDLSGGVEMDTGI